MRKSGKWKKLLSVLLALAMICSVDAPMAVRAAEMPQSESSGKAAEALQSESSRKAADGDSAVSESVPETVTPVRGTENSGTLGENDGITWNYDDATKILTVSGTDELKGDSDFSKGGYYSPFAAIAVDHKFTKIVFDNCKLTGSANHLFFRLTEVTEIDCTELDTSDVTDMQSMFHWCSGLTKVTFGDDFKTGQVENMRWMFSWCSSLETLDLSKFDLRGAANECDDFIGDCEKLTTLHLPQYLGNMYNSPYFPNVFVDAEENEYIRLMPAHAGKTLTRKVTDLKPYDLKWVNGKILWKMDDPDADCFEVYLYVLREDRNDEYNWTQCPWTIDCQKDNDGYYSYNWTGAIVGEQQNARYRVKVRPIRHEGTGKNGLWSEFSDYMDYKIPSNQLDAPAAVTLGPFPGTIIIDAVPNADSYLCWLGREEINLDINGDEIGRYEQGEWSDCFYLDEIKPYDEDSDRLYWANKEKTKIFLDRTGYCDSLQEGRDYYWKVSAMSDDLHTYALSDWQKSDTFRKGTVAGADGEGKYTTPTHPSWEFNWNASFATYTDNCRYEFEIYRDDEKVDTQFLDVWTSYWAPHILSCRAASLITEAGEYQFRVRAVPKSGDTSHTASEWSDLSPKRTHTVPTVKLGTTTPVWDSARPGVIRYDVVEGAGRYGIYCYRLDEDGNVEKHNYTETHKNETEFNDMGFLVKNLGGAGRYQVAVKAFSGDIDTYLDGETGTPSEIFDTSKAVKSKLASPKGLDWDGHIARWGIPSSVRKGYINCDVYRGDTVIEGKRGDIWDFSEMDCSEYFGDSGEYYFKAYIEPASEDIFLEESDAAESRHITYTRPSRELETVSPVWSATRPGVVTFPAVEGAVRYKAFLYKQREDGTEDLERGNAYSEDDANEIDLSWLIENSGAGKYRVKVQALSGDIDTVANGRWSEPSEYFDTDDTGVDNADVKAAPKNVRWDKYDARWKDNSKVNFYELQLRNETTGEEISPAWIKTKKQNGDFIQPLSNAFDESGDYSFRVRTSWAYEPGTNGEMYHVIDAEWSQWSSPVNYSRPAAELGGTVITLGEKPGVMSFTAVEGAAGYEISLRYNKNGSTGTIDNHTLWNGDIYDDDPMCNGIQWGNDEHTVISVDFTKYNNFDVNSGKYWWRIRAISDDIDTLANGHNVEKEIPNGGGNGDNGGGSGGGSGDNGGETGDNENDKPVTYTVTFQMQGHGVQVASATLNTGAKITEPAAPTEDGYTFGGWYKDKDCTIPWNFDTDVVTADTVLYAKWTKDPDTSGSTVTPEDVDDKYYREDDRQDLKTLNYQIADIRSKVYDGKPYLPTVKVTVNIGGKATVLAEGADYRIQYRDNVNAGTGMAIIKGNGLYKGEITKEFKIDPKPIGKLKVSTGGLGKNAPAEKLPVYLYDGGYRLEENKDYTVKAPSGLTAEKGKKTVTVEAVEGGNYTKSRNVQIMVYESDKILQDSDVTLSGYVPEEYTGKPIKPDVAVKFGDGPLDKQYYSVKYTNNKEAGTAYVTVTGKKGYAGVVVKPFEIKPRKDKLEPKTSIKAVTYNGKPQKPKVAVTAAGKTLKAGKDYVLLYSNNIHAGEGKVTIMGLGNYAGASAQPVKFTIQKQKIGKVSVKGTKESGLIVTYAKRQLKEGVDFTTSYGTDESKNKVEVTLTGMGDFKETVTKKVKVK